MDNLKKLRNEIQREKGIFETREETEKLQNELNRLRKMNSNKNNTLTKIGKELKGLGNQFMSVAQKAKVNQERNEKELRFF